MNGVVVQHKGEQQVISNIIKMHREGMSNCAIARVLTEMKVSTKQRTHSAGGRRSREPMELVNKNFGGFMSLFSIVSGLIRFSLAIGLAGGFVDMTRAMMFKAADAHKVRLISLTKLNQALLYGKR